MRILLIFSFYALACLLNRSLAQSFYFGADLSYVNEMEDCGAVYKVNGTPEDPYQIFKDNGANLIRLRLWHTPSWYDALNQGHRYSDFQDVRHSIMRAKAQGMKVLLDYHLSDTWADPGHQVAPLAWTPVLDSLGLLEDSLYNYIHSTLSNLAAENLLPEIVQIGNETNKGILQSQEQNDAGWALDWPRNSALFNTAISAIRDIENEYSTQIKIAIHIANPSDVGWLTHQFWVNGVQDFDIIGISYYWQFHSVLIDVVGNAITDLKNTYPGKEVMIFETAYQWTNSNADGANNILSQPYPGYTPPTPQLQKQWMIDLTQTVIDHGGKGVVYWEPAWVSTPCKTQYGKGSNWDNATFFDFSKNEQSAGGIGWMTHQYDFTLATKEINKISDQIEIYYTGNEMNIKRQDDLILNASFEMELMTIEGKRIIYQKVEPHWINNFIQIHIPELVPGCYFISMTNRNNFFATKMFFSKSE